MRRRPDSDRRMISPYQAYRLRTFSACGLFDVAAISESLLRHSEDRKAKERRAKPGNQVA